MSACSQQSWITKDTAAVVYLLGFWNDCCLIAGSVPPFDDIWCTSPRWSTAVNNECNPGWTPHTMKLLIFALTLLGFIGELFSFFGTFFSMAK